MPEPLAPRQKDVLLFITDYQQRHECAPTVRELCEGLGATSTNTIDYHLKALERKGFIRRRGNLARSIEVFGRIVELDELLGKLRAVDAAAARSAGAALLDGRAAVASVGAQLALAA